MVLADLTCHRNSIAREFNPGGHWRNESNRQGFGKLVLLPFVNPIRHILQVFIASSCYKSPPKKLVCMSKLNVFENVQVFVSAGAPASLQIEFVHS